MSEAKKPRGRKPLAPYKKVRQDYVRLVKAGFTREKILELIQGKYGYHPTSMKKIISHKEAKRLSQL